MSSGRLAGMSVTGGVNTTLYTAPSNTAGAVPVTIGVANRTTKDAKIRIAIVAKGDTVSDDDWLEYDVTIRVGGVIERSDVNLAVGDFIVVYSDKSNITFTAWARQLGVY